MGATTASRTSARCSRSTNTAMTIPTINITTTPYAFHYFHNGYVGKQPVAWKEYCSEYWLKELQESMDMCTGCRNITEIPLKTALNAIHSIYQL